MSDNIPNDPFADRESKNYENPIPSREFILEFLEEAGVPMNRNDLFEALKLEGEEHYEIKPDRCTECVGHFSTPQCVEVCPVDCIPVNPEYIESSEQLQNKYNFLTQQA